MLEFKERIEKGEDFASLASAYSEDIGSAQQGGDLGFAKRGTMVPEFEGAALKLKPNEISEPIESEFGLHLIQLLETRGAEYHSRYTHRPLIITAWIYQSLSVSWIVSII
ncbi:MAG: peptidylprolyl isomerase [Spirosomataceae bacterium]